MTDEKKAPPSTFNEQKEIAEVEVLHPEEQIEERPDVHPEEEQTTCDIESPYTKAIMVLANDDFTQTMLLEEFEYEGVKFVPAPGQAFLLLTSVLNDIKTEQVAQRVLNRVLNEKITFVNRTTGQRHHVPLLEWATSKIAGDVAGQVANQLDEMQIRRGLAKGNGIITKIN